jgi:NADPH-dependent curcumin reductase CurA
MAHFPRGVNRQILLRSLPEGPLLTSHFQLLESSDSRTLSENEVLVEVKTLVLDAAARTWMQGQTYRSKLEAGNVMPGGGIGKVIESRHDDLSPGDLVYGETGWLNYAYCKGAELQKLNPHLSLEHQVSVFGYAGLTAYFGLLDVGKAQHGETVVVSAAAGAVGSIAGQIAKIRGCRVIGIAGSDAKCALLTTELGFDGAINYKVQNVREELVRLAPRGIDVYFDNVAGDILESCLSRMSLNGRIVCCGALSQYDGAPPAKGPKGVPGILIARRISMLGFVVFDHLEQRHRALTDLKRWVETGELKVYHTFVSGLENAPKALVGLLSGENIGKFFVRIDTDNENSKIAHDVNGTAPKPE